MKEKYLDFTFCFICVISIVFIFKNNTEVALTIIEACHLFLTKVFVSLFPMFIINDILISINIPYYFYKLFNKPFTKLFKTSGLASYVLIMSLISGTPSQAYILKNLQKENKITINEANHFLYFTYFSNPLFLYTMLRVIFNLNTTIKIILIHYLSNLIIAYLIRKKAPKINNNPLTLKHVSLIDTLIKSISKSINTLLIILGTIVFYMLINYIITNLFPLNPFFKTLIAGILEITNGLNHLKNLTLIPKLKEIMAITIISFGGLSIHTQVKALLEDTEIKFKSFFKGRLLQTLISIILIIIF